MTEQKYQVDKFIQNPILTGFNPDPSIIRVGDDYYIATSTFEWFPGCQIHHSKDLKHWQLINRPLDRVSQLDMCGVPDSCGVWAPCLTYCEGVFYLLYSNVKSFDGLWKDTPNYLVTATDIQGPWSEPTFINASGFDASLFHDDDGKCYLLNMVVDHRNGKFFGGIVIQQFCKHSKKLIGKIHHIFEGTEHGRTEGPHLYKRNGWYYLLIAEGGTSYEHCVTLARSRSLFGPYEVHPNNPVITAKYNAQAPLQKLGHADLVETQNGDWYAVFLTGRPINERGRCIMGRETALEQVEWRQDNWLYLTHNSKEARLNVEPPNLPCHRFPISPQTVNFDTSKLDIQFQSLRTPMSQEWVTTQARQGYLRLHGKESLSSCFHQSLIGRRVQAHCTNAETCVEFSPDNFQQMAGLVCYYNTFHYHYLHIYGDDFGAYSGKKFLTILTCDNHETSQPNEEPIEITGADRIYLKAEFYGANLQFFYALSPGNWLKIGPSLDGSILSDDYVEHGESRFHPCFTGAFYCLACQDLSGQNLHADFSYFSYREIAE